MWFYVVSGSTCDFADFAQTSRLEAVVLCRVVSFCAVLCYFVSLKDRRAILQIVRKRRGWRPLRCAVLCRFVLFCAVLCRLRIDVRFYRFCTNVEAGGRRVVQCCVVLCRFMLFCIVEG